MYEILKYVDIITPALLLFLAGVIYFYRNKKPKSKDFIILSYYGLQFFLNYFANFMQDQGRNNHWVYHLNSLCTILLLLLFYYIDILRSFKKYIIITFIFYLIFSILNLFFFQPINTFPSYSFALSSFLILFWELLHFKKILNDLPVTKISDTKDFWIGVSILFYFGSSFFIFISYNYLSGVSPKNVGILWRIHNVFFAINCLILFKALRTKKWILKYY